MSYVKIGVAGPVGSGKTALIECLTRQMASEYSIGVITNDIYTKEDAEFLSKNSVLPRERITGVETGGCPHTAIREDASMNLEAVEEMMEKFPDIQLLFIESGGDNLSATFSPELVDATIFVIDVAEGDKIPRKGGPGITKSDLLVINKIDTVEKENLLAVIAAYAAKFEFDAVVPVSAKFGDGIPDLLRECARHAADSPFLFPDDMTTDQPERQVMAEIIREKLLWNLEREIPHGTAVEITKFSERDSGVIDIDATIYCEKASHKGIIIGKRGAMLKEIGQQARADIERMLDAKVFLELWVKVKEGWRNNQYQMRNFGYEEQ